MGFVSALSSSVAVIILIMAVMLVNSIQSALNAKNKSQDPSVQAQVVEVEGKSKEKTQTKLPQAGTVDLNPNLVTKQMLTELEEINPKTISTYCEYGNNYSYEVATRFTTFNSVVLYKGLKGKDAIVDAAPPVFIEDKQNKCYIKYEWRNV